MLSLIAAGLLAAAEPAAASEAPPPEPAACHATGSCRYVGPVMLRTRPGVTNGMMFNRWEPMIVDGNVHIYVGEYAIFRLDTDASGRTRPVFVASGPAVDTDITGLEADFAANRAALDAAGEASAVPMTGNANIPMLPPNFIRATLLQLRGTTDTVLVIQNSYGNVLDYKADISTYGKDPEPTSVCDVTSGRAVLEHWGWGISAIDLHDLNLLSTETAGLRDCE